MDIAVTGGIGTGKSTVAAMLAAKGGVHLNADAIVHELQQPGNDVFKAMVKHFGEGVVAADGSLDRQAVADIVFGDESQLSKLNELVHPAVRREMHRRREALKGSGKTVICEIPLLVEGRLKQNSADAVADPTPSFDAVVVVIADREIVLLRLEQRGMPRDEALARMSKQASDTQRRAVADYVIDNSGNLDQLAQAVERCWTWLEKAAAESRT